MRQSSRREFIFLAGAAGVVAGCGRLVRQLPGNEVPESVALPAGDVHPTFRLLNRAGFGPRPGDVAAVAAQGHGAWLESQLHPDKSESPRLNTQLARLDVWQENPEDLLDLRTEEVVAQLNQAQLLRATYSRWQLQERMTTFWADHFNVYAHKADGAFRLGKYEYETIRDHALGTFPELLGAVAHSPAMLAYLDNQQNVNGVANENYARELMELHTLGVHGGYTQKDVQEVARCFTGWTFERRFLHRKGSFTFDPTLHDKGEKHVLGHRIPAGGNESDAAAVLTIVANHPATADFISAKLCRHFLGDANHPMKAKLASVFKETGGDIKALCRTLFLSNELLTGPPVAKRPFDYVVSALRATAADTDGGDGVQHHLGRMGQTLYEWPMPDGYPDRAAAWTGSLLARWNFALALAHGKLEGTDTDLKGLHRKSGEASAGPAMRAVLLAQKAPHPAPIAHASTVADATALCLASPDFQLK